MMKKTLVAVALLLATGSIGSLVFAQNVSTKNTVFAASQTSTTIKCECDNVGCRWVKA